MKTTKKALLPKAKDVLTTNKTSQEEKEKRAEEVLDKTDLDILEQLVKALQYSNSKISEENTTIADDEEMLFREFLKTMQRNKTTHSFNFNNTLQALEKRYSCFSTMASRDELKTEVYSILHEINDKEYTLLLTKVLYIFGYLNKTNLNEIRTSVQYIFPNNAHSKIFGTIASIPFGIKKTVNTDINNIENIMNEEMYGLKEVKESITNILTLNKFSRKHTTTPLILYGPPGVGKTLFAQVLAKALNLPFYKINFSSAYDRAYLKGSNRTWNNSDIGEITRIFMKAKCMNPVILFDEIDKSGGSSAGNFIDTITEILDPEQRCFKDDHLSITLDMSSTYIVCTANDMDKVPNYIKDRCEAIEVRGYNTQEIEQIVKNYLPRQIVRQFELEFDIEIEENVAQKLTKIGSLRAIQREIKKLTAQQLKRGASIQKGKLILNNPTEVNIQQPQFDQNKIPIGFCR